MFKLFSRLKQEFAGDINLSITNSCNDYDGVLVELRWTQNNERCSYRKHFSSFEILDVKCPEILEYDFFERAKDFKTTLEHEFSGDEKEPTND